MVCHADKAALSQAKQSKTCGSVSCPGREILCSALAGTGYGGT